MAKKQTKAQRAQDEVALRKNPINEFTCCGKCMQFKEFEEHILTIHKLTKEQFKGKRSMLMHMDGDYWFSYNYQWELESGLKFTQYTMMARDIDDYMRF